MAYEIPRHVYTHALKREAIHRLREQGKSLAQVAQELGISPNRLGEWLIAVPPPAITSPTAAPEDALADTPQDAAQTPQLALSFGGAETTPAHLISPRPAPPAHSAP